MRFVVLGLVLALVASCSNRSMDTAMRSAEVKSSLDSLWTRYADAADRRDRIAFGHLFNEDAVLVFSNAPTIRGRPAIEEFLISLYTTVDLTKFRVVPEDLTVSGPLAAQAGSFQEDFTEAGKPLSEVGRFTLIAEQGPDKAWRVRRLTVMADSMRDAAAPMQ
jgi:ketosteroid isomerase-like protein